MRKMAILAIGFMALAALLAFASTALAVAPHGGYSTGNAVDGGQTDLCLSCHDVHNAAGDYVLMREATVTAVCGTCHVVFGEPTNGTPHWTEPPCPGTPDNSGDDGTSSGCTTDLHNPFAPEAGVSPTSAYENLTPVSGHRLGTNSTKANPDYIPASTSSLKVIKSADYAEGEIYDHNPPSSLSATAGLYCASCHTPHGALTGRDTDADGYADIPEPCRVWNSGGTAVTSEFFCGDQLVADDTGAEHPHRAWPQWLLSSNPNHLSAREMVGEADGNGNGVFCEATDGWTTAKDTIIKNGKCDSFMTPVNPVTARDEFCVRCHDLQWSAESVFTDKGLVPMSEGVGADEGHSLSPNHPPLCMSCHGPVGSPLSAEDFPHTSMNYKILSKDHDGLCLGCHSGGRLP